MESKEKTQASNGNINYNKWKAQIGNLYAGLNKIASDEESDLGSIKKDFDRFFASGKKTPTRNMKEKYTFLFRNEILDGTFTNERSSISQLQRHEHIPINGNTLLIRAMSINFESERKHKEFLYITKLMIQRCPELIVFPENNKDFTGITPLHLAILKEDLEILKSMSESLKDIPESRLQREKIQGLCAEGSIFQDTVMMAGTPLGVAALTFNKEVFKITLFNFATGLDVTNDKGDTIVHSLIKYACVRPDKLNDIIDMLTYVSSCDIELISEDQGKKYRKQAQKLLMIKNKEKLNAMQLAAKRQQFRIFEYIMQSKVYRSKEFGNGLFNEEIYDITEIETLDTSEKIIMSQGEHLKQDHHESVMEYLVHHETSAAFLFIDYLPIREVVRTKWKYYSRLFIGWFALHLLFMVILSVAAVYRSKHSTPVSKNSKVQFSYRVRKDAFVTSVSVLSVIYGVMLLFIELITHCSKQFRYTISSNYNKRIKHHISMPYSNVVFRIYFSLFSLLLIIDCITAFSSPKYENYCLIFAVIIGWYLVIFFLQTFKEFSMFTVLIQKAILDMLNFAVVMTFFLVAFSVAMYMIMQGADTEEDDFNYFDKTVLKMLTIMLGIGELGILFQARHPYLAIFVFVLFVVLTAILLLNALIAMMSNTCTDLTNNYGGLAAANLHCRLQKLSVILFLEGFLPRCLCKEVGVKRSKCRYENNEWVKNVARRVWVRSSVFEHSTKETDKMSNELLLTHRTTGFFPLLMQHLPLDMKGKRSKKVSSSTSDLSLRELKLSHGRSENLDIRDNVQNINEDLRNMQIEKEEVPENI